MTEYRDSYSNHNPLFTLFKKWVTKRFSLMLEQGNNDGKIEILRAYSYSYLYFLKKERDSVLYFNKN